MTRTITYVEQRKIISLHTRLNGYAQIARFIEGTTNE